MGLGDWIRCNFLARRVRISMPAPGIEFAEGRSWRGKRVGMWRERIGDCYENTQYRDGKKSGPSRRVRDDGLLVIERSFIDDQPSGPFRSFHANGQPLNICTFVAGRLVGLYTSHREDGSLSARLTFLDGKRHGECIESDEDGSTLVGSYENDRREGVFVKTARDGTVLEEARYQNDLLDGTFRRAYATGATKLQTIYRAGIPSKFEIFTETGEALGLYAANSADEAEQWINLDRSLRAPFDTSSVDAWHRHNDELENAIFSFPAEYADEVVAFCQQRGFEGYALSGCKRFLKAKADARFGLANAIVLDHAVLKEYHIEQMRTSPLLREIMLYEVGIQGTLRNWLAAGGPPRLQKLSIEYCYCQGESLADMLTSLADSPVAALLCELSILHEGPADWLKSLLRSSRFKALRRLSLGAEVRQAVDALAEGPTWQALEVIRLDIDLGDRDPCCWELIDAITLRRFPKLRHVEDVQGGRDSLLIKGLSKKFGRSLA